MSLTSQEGSQEVRNAAPNEWLSSDFHLGLLRWVTPQWYTYPITSQLCSRKELERDHLSDEVVFMQ